MVIGDGVGEIRSLMGEEITRDRKMKRQTGMSNRWKLCFLFLEVMR